MKNLRTIYIGFILVLMLGVFQSCTKQDGIKALILTGQNNHDWPTTHLILEKILINSEAIGNIDIILSPEAGEDMSDFLPNFAAYDVVVLDYNGDAWAEKTKTAFVDYVKNGGGLVVYHASNNAFSDWKEYNEIIGLGGWNDRNENSGPYLYYVNDEPYKDYSEGAGGSHGAEHAYVVHTRDEAHPIMNGFPEFWKHGQDELYDRLRGPAENINVLATAYSDTATGGSGRHEPVIFTVAYGKGRVFHTVLGHVDLESYAGMQCAGFILTLQRGTEWAATGNVLQPINEDLPNVSVPLLFPNYKNYSLDELFTRSKSFEIGQTQKYLHLISQRIRNHSNDAEEIRKIEKGIIKLLKDEGTSVDAVNYFCREISWMGSEKSISILEDLKEKEETKEMAIFALSRLK